MPLTSWNQITMQNEHSDLVIMGGISDDLIEKLIREIQKDRYQRNIPLRLFINSPGGSIPLALSISRLLLNLFDYIETYNLATVDSSAICLYLTGNKRCCFPNSRFFLHPPSISLNDHLTQNQLQENITLIRSDTKSMLNFYHERTHIETGTLESWFNHTIAFSGIESIKQNISTDICADISDFSPCYINS